MILVNDIIWLAPRHIVFLASNPPLTSKSSYDWGPKGHLALQNHCRRLAPPFGSLRTHQTCWETWGQHHSEPTTWDFVNVWWCVIKWGWPLILLVILIGNNDHKWNQQWPGSQICGTTTPPNVHGLTPIKISFSCMLNSSIKIRMPRNFGADLRFTKCCPHFEASRPTFFRSSSGSSPRWYHSRFFFGSAEKVSPDESSFLSSWLFFFSVFFPSSAHSGTCPRRYLTGSTSWPEHWIREQPDILASQLSWSHHKLVWICFVLGPVSRKAARKNPHPWNSLLLSNSSTNGELLRLRACVIQLEAHKWPGVHHQGSSPRQRIECLYLCRPSH